VRIIEAPGLGKILCEEIDIMRLLDAFKLIDGPTFVPVEIGITGKSIIDLESVLPKGDYRIRLNQEESWVLFNSSLLSKKIPNILPNASIDDIVQTKRPISFKIEMMLDSFQAGHILTMEELAIMFGVSKRTLERKLLSEGTNFSHIKEKYLLRKSFELLQDSKLSVKEIAEQLNYANSQNYIRRFKAQTGTTPMVYRLDAS
jgi:AraC-like DNA-binding protein